MSTNDDSPSKFSDNSTTDSEFSLPTQNIDTGGSDWRLGFDSHSMFGSNFNVSESTIQAVYSSALQSSEITSSTSTFQTSDLSPPNAAADGNRNLKRLHYRRLGYQIQLALMFHAHKCERRPDPLRDCTMPNCDRAKILLQHMATCTAGGECTVAHCKMSCMLLGHWRNCILSNCPICAKFRRDSISEPVAPSLIHTAKKRPAEDEVSNNPSKRLNTGLNHQPSSDQSSTVNQQIFHPCQSNISEEAQTPATQPSTCTQNWQRELGPKIRNQFIYKLTQAIIPLPDPNQYREKRMQRYVKCAASIEKSIYDNAPSSDAYYSGIAEKIYNIHQTLERKKRHDENMRRTTTLPTNVISSPFETSNIITQPHIPTTNCGIRNTLWSQSTEDEIDPDLLSALPNHAVTATNFQNNCFSNNLLHEPYMAQSSSVNIYHNQHSNSLIDLAQICTDECSVEKQQQHFEFAESWSSDFMTSDACLQQTSLLTESPFYSSSSSQCNSFQEEWQQFKQSQEYQDQLQQSVQFQQELKLSPTQQQLYQQSFEGKFKPQECELVENNHNVSSVQQPESQWISSQVHQFDSNLKIKIEPIEEVEWNIHSSASMSTAMVKTEETELHCKTEELSIKVDLDLNSRQMAFVDTKPESHKKMHMEPQIPKFSHKPDDLRQKLKTILAALYRQHPESLPFQQPVDPVLQQIPHYFDIVKNPMDLSTITSKLNSGEYRDPWQFIDDVCLMFDNAWLFNRKNTYVYRCCTKLSSIFESTIDSVMQSLGYCCGRKYAFSPQVICCYGKQLCTIQRDANYWSYQHGSGKFSALTVRYTYCEKCFANMPGETISIGDDLSQSNVLVKKESFIKMKNDVKENETFVTCVGCGRKLHQICVIYFPNCWPNGYVCNVCSKTKRIARLNNKIITAKDLPATKLGTHIEIRVNKYLANVGVGKITIRVLSISDKKVEVKSGMKDKFVAEGEFPVEFPYRAKAIFAFQNIDGQDVCFFGMHVQEFGSECPQPNRRRVYISYLDSVHFFSPKYLKTKIYHEILLGYLDYVKRLGFIMAHIWACPPSDGQDYIFNCHPTEQKIPKPKRLQDWYKQMLDRGTLERIVLDYKDVLKQAEEDKLSSATELPYFEGDFWPIVLEDCIKELEKEEQQRMLEEASADATADCNDYKNETVNFTSGKRKGKKKPKKACKNNTRKNSRKPSTEVRTLTDKIYNMMKKHRQVFLVIRLHPFHTTANLQKIQDPDPALSCSLMDGRDAFLTLCRDKHYEFSSLRRSKYSTAAMLRELQTQHRDNAFIYTCNNCRLQLETRLNCTVCEDFDLCKTCYEKIGHQHEMQPIEIGTEIESSNPRTSGNSDEIQTASMKRVVYLLEHASLCHDESCVLKNCCRAKRVIQHVKSCDRSGGKMCNLCQQYFSLCIEHVRNCQEMKCLVPFCSAIKRRNQQQDLQRRLQKQHSLMLRVASMTSTQHSSTPEENCQKYVDKKSAKINNSEAKASEVSSQMQVDEVDSAQNKQTEAKDSVSTTSMQVDGTKNDTCDSNFVMEVATEPPIAEREEIVCTENEQKQAITEDERTRVCLERTTQAIRLLVEQFRLPKPLQNKQLIVRLLNANPILLKAFLKHSAAARKEGVESRIIHLASHMKSPWKDYVTEVVKKSVK